MTNGYRYFQDGLREFKEKYDRNIFQFQHYLAGHPLFELPRLIELVRDRPSDPFYYDIGDASPQQRWHTLGRELSVPDAIEQIEQSKAWIVINHAEKDPAYQKLLNEALDEILAGCDIKKSIKSREVIIFVSSPRRVTIYHIDRECNFLLQIKGDKTIHIFDRDDREVLTEQEIETFWSVDNNSPRYKPELQDRASTYLLTPGRGVHIPVNCPHWLENGDNVSISVSINFQFHDHLLENVYKVNYYMRKIGLRPTPPRRRTWTDSLKGVGSAPVFAGRRLARRLGQS